MHVNRIQMKAVRKNCAQTECRWKQWEKKWQMNMSLKKTGELAFIFLTPPPPPHPSHSPSPDNPCLLLLFLFPFLWSMWLPLLVRSDLCYSRSSPAVADCSKPDIVHGYLDKDARFHSEVGRTAVYQCYDGYVSDDPIIPGTTDQRVATCGPSGTWSLARCAGEHPWQMRGTASVFW